MDAESLKGAVVVDTSEYDRDMCITIKQLDGTLVVLDLWDIYEEVSTS